MAYIDEVLERDGRHGKKIYHSILVKAIGNVDQVFHLWNNHVCLVIQTAFLFFSEGNILHKVARTSDDRGKEA